MRKVLICTTALTVFAMAVPAYAQEADGSGGIEEIIVTAQKKEESAQKAGIAIDAVSADKLLDRGIVSALDITKSVPAISFANPGGNVTSIFLRGVGNITTSSYVDPAVTPSYDGVVLGRGGGVFGAAFFDLSRVEVLKGPQGILYGRNATGGAVNVLPARPEIGSTGAGFNVSFGNYDTVNADAYVNVATGENSALRIAGSRQTHDGYNLDGTDDKDVSGLRAQYLIKPSEDLSVRLSADWTDVGGAGIGGNYTGVFVPNGTGGYTFLPSNLGISEGMNSAASNVYRQGVLGSPGFGFLNSMNRPQTQDITYWGVNAEVIWKTGIGTVTILPAYRSTKDRTFFYGPAFNTANTNEDIDQYSLEARLGGSAGMFDYVLGTFLYKERIQGRNQYNQEFVLPIQQYDQSTKSVAAFGQLTAHVTDQLRLLGGARYTRDRKNMDGLLNNFITFCGGTPGNGFATPPASFGLGCANPGALPHYPNFLTTTDTLNWLTGNGWIAPSSTLQPNAQVFSLTNGIAQILKTHKPVVGGKTFSRVTWKLSTEYDLAPSNMLYATVETGYRAGGFQLSEGQPVYQPEFITAFSVGSKNRFFNNRLQVNFEGFLWKYKDQQITYFTVDSSGTLISSNENAGKATIKGFDIDMIARPARNTTIGMKVQYLDTKYDDLHLYTAAPRDNFACGSTAVTYGSNSRFPATTTNPAGTPVLAGGAQVKDFNCSSNPSLFSPKWTVNIDAEQVVPLNDDLDLVGNISTAWRAKQWGAFEYLPFELIPSYWTTDASITLRKSDGALSLTAFAYNLENKRRDIAPQSSPIGVAISHYTAPRTYGLRLSGRF